LVAHRGFPAVGGDLAQPDGLGIVAHISLGGPPTMTSCAGHQRRRMSRRNLAFDQAADRENRASCAVRAAAGPCGQNVELSPDGIIAMRLAGRRLFELAYLVPALSVTGRPVGPRPLQGDLPRGTRVLPAGVGA
jgi:hypothetical protein